MKTTEYQKFEEYAQTQCKGLNLQSLLINPISRLPRYKLLLSEIIKNTEKEHFDYESLKKALSEIEKTTTTINEGIKDYESRTKVFEIQLRLINPENWVKPDRLFIKQGILTKIVSASSTGKDESFEFILFSDMLIYCTKEKKDKLRLKNKLEINDTFIIKNIDENNNKFEINSSQESFVVCANTLTEKNDWINVLTQTVSDFKLFFFFFFFCVLNIYVLLCNNFVQLIL